MSATRGLRAILASGMVTGAVLVAPGANAGNFALDVHVDGIANGGNYSPSSFDWPEPFVVSFTHTTDASTSALMAAAQEHRELGNAVLHQTLSGTATITLAMSGVHVEAVHEKGGSDGPVEQVELRFRAVTYTFQPLNPIGQKSGPPVTFTWNQSGKQR
jgi:type VI protein secretion system component Hcp